MTGLSVHAGALAQAFREIDSAPDLDATLNRIVETAARSLPRIDHVGISLVTAEKIETKAATGQIVWDLDSFQYRTDQGPCIDAMRPDQPPVVVVNNIRREQRWPDYLQLALPTGLQAQMGIRLYREGRTYGGLNMYSLEHETIDADTESMAVLFAAHAEVALGKASALHHLNKALKSRKLIGQAIGIVSERYTLDQHRAFEYLIRVSQHGNIKMRDVADEIVRLRDEGSPGPMKDTDTF